MTIGSLFNSLKTELTKKFGASEAKEMVLLIFESLKGWSQTDILIKQDEEVSDFITAKAEDIVKKTLEGEPLQYILGVAHFYGLKFKVTPATLIPRPETTELVDLIVNKFGDRKDLRVLDLGTGSGCIAIALARNLKFADITATDISDEALKVARENASDLKVNIDFRKEDILNMPPADEKFDIIVSNPPYILLSEAESMDLNVLDYEPASALFVPDNDPLKFYTPTIQYAAENLNKGGGIYFEINPMFADRIKKEMQRAGFEDVNVVKDISAKNRFVYAIK